MTLGRHSGAAVIGRPLDIRIPLSLAADEDATALCIQTDVSYGDTPISSGAVRSTPQKLAPDAQASIRIQSSVAINEPIVTVSVRAGCSTPFTRRYVLLADPVSEPATSANAAFPGRTPGLASAAAVPPASDIAASALPPSAGTPQGRGEGAARESSQPRPVKAPRAEPKPKPARAPAASVVRKAAEAPANTAPRLQLDPVDLSLNIERDPVLRLSLTLLSTPTDSVEERAAAGLLWKAINATPEEILRDSQKLAVLEAESKGLRAEESKNKATIDELNASLQQLKSERYLNWVVYLLGALLLLALLALLFLWKRRNEQERTGTGPAWWAAAGESKKVRATKFAEALEPEAGVDVDLDLDLDLNRESSFGVYRPPAGGRQDEESGPAVLLGSEKKTEVAGTGARSLATEELFDLQQQADFFVSLGEDDKAIEVLRNHVMESHEPSALGYLDLFRLYHKLNRKDDYERLREDFNHVFNAGAPPFDQYSEESRGLESYETAFSRIQALWPQPKVLDVIEQSIFRQPGDDEQDTEVFGLEAYRELLLLHSIAKDMIRRDAGKTVPMEDFEHTSLQPLKAANKAAPVDALNRNTQPMGDASSVSPNFGLDVDLSELSEFSAFEASLPVVPVPVLPTAKPVPRPGPVREQPQDNLIDFEILDFSPPEDGDSQDGPPPEKP